VTPWILFGYESSLSQPIFFPLRRGGSPYQSLHDIPLLLLSNFSKWQNNSGSSIGQRSQMQNIPDELKGIMQVVSLVSGHGSRLKSM
jgi:hypothetical protein